MSGADSLDLETIFEGADPKAEDIANKWLEWDGARNEAKERWKETQQYVYATSTRETNNSTVGGFLEDSDGWQHSTHVPKLTQIADNLSANYMSAIVPHEEFFKYIGEDQEASIQEVRETVEAYLRSKHRNNKFRQVLQKLLDDWILYGNCFAEVTYLQEFVTQEDGVPRKGYSGPVISRISPFDIVFNPLASSFENSPKIVRTLKTLGELQRDIEEKPELGYSQDIFDKIIKSRNSLHRVNTEDFNKHTQLQFDGFGTPSQYFNSGYVEILEFYGDLYDVTNQKFLKNHVITVVDRSFVIRSQPLDTWTGRPHIYHVGWRLRQDNLWAMGPLDNLVGMQYLINHLENARADAFDQMLAPTRVIVGDVEKFAVEAGVPGGEYHIPSGEGSVANLAPDTTVLTADIQIDRKFAQMEEFAGAPRQEAGNITPGERSATEASLINRAASRIFQNKINHFETFLEKLLNAELEVARTNLDAADLISVVDEDGLSEFISITKEDLKSNGKLVPIGARHFARQNQLITNFQILQQSVQQDPLLLQHFSSVKMARMIEQLMDFNNGDIVFPYARVGEEANLAKLSNVAQTQIEVEDQINLDEESEEDFE